MTAFVLAPIRHFWNLRGEVAGAMYRAARFIPGPPSIDNLLAVRGATPPERGSVADELSRVGLKLIAFWDNEALARWCLKCVGMDGGQAGRDLVELSDSIADRVSFNEPRRSVICSALKLPV